MKGTRKDRSNQQQKKMARAHRLFQDRLALLGLLVITVMILAGILAPWAAPHDPAQLDLGRRLEPASPENPLGTDQLGRCILSRLIYGARISLSTSFLCLAAIILISVPVGILSGYIGGSVDNLIMRLLDILLAFPGLVLALVIVGMLGPGLLNVMIAIASVGWVSYARVIRGVVLSVKEKEFILAARSSGASDLAIIVRHILPHVLSPVIVLATLDMGSLILAIAGFSYLGLGAQPPTAEWGTMLSDGRDFMQRNPTLMLYPGMVIMVAVLAFNMLGDGLRDALDPRDYLQKKRYSANFEREKGQIQGSC